MTDHTPTVDRKATTKGTLYRILCACTWKGITWRSTVDSAMVAFHDHQQQDYQERQR